MKKVNMSLGFCSAFCTCLLILVVTACSRKEDYVTPLSKDVDAENDSIPGELVTDDFGNTRYFVSSDSCLRSNFESGWIEELPVLHGNNPIIEPYLESIDFTFCKMSRHYYN
jgi:hypothetical protein